ncbi:MAG: hypothetical protein AAGU18_10835 [Proteiniphilum sp.]
MDIREEVSKILLDVRDGKELHDSAVEKIMTVIRQIDEFDIYCTKLKMEDQLRLRMMMAPGDIIIKPDVK